MLMECEISRKIYQINTVLHPGIAVRPVRTTRTYGVAGVLLFYYFVRRIS